MSKTIYVMCEVSFDWHEFRTPVAVSETIEGLEAQKDRDLPLVKYGSDEENEVATGDGYSHYCWEEFSL